MIEVNKIYCEDNLVTMDKMADGSVDLTITSPPYDNLRSYNGYVFDFEKTAIELHRVIKIGGVVVWVVGDETINGSESGTSLKQALYFKELGFRLHDTMIYKKNSAAYPSNRKSNRYTQIFEFMYVFSKGAPKTVNLICDKKNKWEGFSSFDKKIPPVPKHSPRENIWEYTTSFNDKTEHPAVFPEQLAADHIYSWSNKGDLVYDPLMGSGTVAKMAHLQHRDFIGSEISKEYCDIANKRLKPYMQQVKIIY